MENIAVAYEHCETGLAFRNLDNNETELPGKEDIDKNIVVTVETSNDKQQKTRLLMLTVNVIQHVIFLS